MDIYVVMVFKNVMVEIGPPKVKWNGMEVIWWI